MEFDQIKRAWEWTGGYAPTYGDAFPKEGYAPSGDNCHDDGPRTCFGLGGIGTGNFGRDLDGRFSRWHLQNGYHRHLPVDAAHMRVRWRRGDTVENYRLCRDGNENGLPDGTHSVRPLFPVVRERMAADEWPVEMQMESYSPVIPGDYEASALPVAFFDLHVRNRCDETVEFDAAFFWPNPVEWRPGGGAPLAEGASLLLYEEAEQAALSQPAWEDLCNAGNICRPVEAGEVPESGFLGGIRYANTFRDEPARDQQGEWLLGVCGEGARFSRATSFSCFGPKEGYGQDAWMMTEITSGFSETGVLPDRGLSWPAMSFEVLGGAVSGGRTLEPGESATIRFFLVWDTPLVEFGAGRTWRKKYTETFGHGGKASAAIATHALARRAEWRERIAAWHRSVTDREGLIGESPRLAGAVLNELYFIADGGTVWLSGEHSASGLSAPRLGEGEHFSLLEGYDIGYFYYSTFDLYPHAMGLIEACWPAFGELLFEDFVRSIPVGMAEHRPYYHDASVGPVLVEGTIPHDIGSPPADPWHILNDYQYRVDSNQWKDHDPCFILGYALHRRFAGRAVPAEHWEKLLVIAEHMERLDKDGDGLPEHDTHGDSTWDAIEEVGPAIFSAALTLGAWAALTAIARDVGDESNVAKFAEKFVTARQGFENAFWTGGHYRNATTGERAEWVMADGLFGVFLARRAGLGWLLPEDRIRDHMRKVFEANFRSNEDGSHGPTLLAPPEGWGGRSGGTQVGEVLVGSSWSCAALMEDVGLREEARVMGEAVVDVLYRRSGLQFRTPAAWTKDGQFRAALNLRPMAIGYLLGGPAG